ncbi:MAG: hypothetical protein K8S97_17160 [Anaerolineae bacterium]|nr:hypothetical protein [Anaerolineae bacterium]
MTTRLFRRGALIVAAVLIVGLLPGFALAQDGGTGDRFESTGLGVAFDLPDGWQVIEEDGELIAGLPNDLATVQNGGPPATLTVRIVFGTFNQLGITDATELPDLLTRLVASTVAPPAPERVEWGNASGYQALVNCPPRG